VDGVPKAELAYADMEEGPWQQMQVRPDGEHKQDEQQAALGQIWQGQQRPSEPLEPLRTQHETWVPVVAEQVVKQHREAEAAAAAAQPPQTQGSADAKAAEPEETAKVPQQRPATGQKSSLV